MASCWPRQAVPLHKNTTSPAEQVTEITFSVDGNTLAACTADGAVTLWDIPDSGLPAPLSAPAGGEIDCTSPFTLEVYGTVSATVAETEIPAVVQATSSRVVLSPDGRSAASVSQDIVLWSLSQPGGQARPGPSLLGFRNFRYVTSVAFSPDSLLMAASTCDSRDGESCEPSGLRLWDVSNPRSPGLLGKPVTGPAGEPVDLVFSPDGDTLAASSHQAIMLWDVGVDNWQDRACQLAGRNLSEDEWRQYLGSREYDPTCRTLRVSE